MNLLVEVLHMSTHLLQSFEIVVIFFTLSKKISILLPKFVHLFLILFFVGNLSVDYFADIITNFFELDFFIFCQSFLLDKKCVKLLFVSFYLFFKRFDSFLLIQKCLELSLKWEYLFFKEIYFILFRFDFLSHLPGAIR